MGVFRNIYNKLIIEPVAKQMIDAFKPLDADSPQKYTMPIGYNSQSVDQARKTAGDSLVSMNTLRQLSVRHETTRAAINVRKRQITQLDWNIVDADPDNKTSYSDNELKEIKNRLRNIGGVGVTFRSILDQLIEDCLVLDALTFYKQKTVGGDLLRIVPIDGATIKLRVDENGLMPLPPEIAFEQWILGSKVSEMTTDEMSYNRMNPRTNSPYGLSPLESLIITVDSSLRAALYNSAYLSDNNIPMGFINVPPEWTPAQLKEYKEFFDAMVASPKDQAKIFPIPAGAKYQPATKPKDFSFGEFYSYLDRKVAMLFDITPQELGLELQQYKENADSQEEIQMRKGLKPLAHFIEDVFTQLLRDDMGYPDLALRFSGIETRFSMNDIKTYVPLGVIGIDEVRNDMALPKLNVPPLIIQGGNVTPVMNYEVDEKGEFVNKPTTVSGMQTEVKPPEKKAGDSSVDLKLWEKKALSDIKKKGKVYRKFESEYIDKEIFKNISSELSKAKDSSQVKRIFRMKGNKDQNSLSDVESHAKFRQFRNAIQEAIKRQYEPFTHVANIAAVTATKKDVQGDVQDNVDGFFNSIKITGLEDFMRWAFGQGVQTARARMRIGGTFQIPNDKFKEFFAERDNYLIDGVDSTTKDQIVNQIVRGKMQGMTNDEIAAQMAESMDEIASSRADTIVNTEVANAMQQAELDTYQEQGIQQKTWVTSEDELVCPVCGDMDGEVQNVDDEFSSGDDAPPAHPNCRCYIQAVLDEA